MLRHFIFMVVLVWVSAEGICDTFKNLVTKESFNGYATQKVKDGKTVVHIAQRGPEFVDLSNHEVIYNHLGREKVVFIFSLTEPVNLISEMEVFERSIVSASNDGPLFILIELDAVTGRIDLLQRMCEAIISTYNCPTVCYIKEGMSEGAYSHMAALALACDKLFMGERTLIGGKPLRPASLLKTDETSQYNEETFDEEALENWYSYCSEIARLNNRPPLLSRAFVDPEMEVLEVASNGNRIFIKPEEKKEDQKLIRTWTEKGTMLRMTAEQAADKGVADQVIRSREMMLAELEADKVKEIRDRRMSKARREYERSKRRLEEALWDVEALEEEVELLLEDYNTLDKAFRRLNKMTLVPRPPAELGRMEALLVERDIVLDRFMAASDALMAQYERAIAIAEDSVDLEHRVESLEEAQKSVREKQSEVLMRPVL